MQNNRMNVKSIIADANLRRDLMVPTIQAIQAREGIETNYEQADRAYCVARIKELEKQITAARNDYYNGVSKITDQHYDALVDELSLLDPKNLAVIGIGAEPVSNWEKFTHQFPMGSLNKSQTQEEFIKWSNDHISKDDEIFLTLKLDGLSISLVYENGILIKAVTRGSGTTGEIITPNVARMQNVPLRLKQKISATIRGEIVLSKDNHQKYFSEYSNTRNAASGISRRYDGQGCEHLSILVYQMYSEDFDLITQKQQFEELSKLGFRVPAFYIAKSNDEVEDIRNLYQTSLRDQYEFDLDGLVAHNNDIAKLESFGSVNNRPKGSIAIKFDSIAKEATIANIIVQTGNSGRITPIAVFSPKVQLMGAEVEKASLHNFSNIADLGIDIGAKVLVCRSNDVIPFVKEVTQSTGTIFQPPVHCSQCGSETIKNGEYLQCSGDRCPAKIIGKLINWISEINVLEWGESLLEKLITSGKVKDIADLYKLSIDDLSSIERMGKKSAKNCYEALHSNKEIPLEIFIGGLSIPLIGQSTIKIIMNAGYKTLDAFFQAKASDFESVIGVGPTKALSLATGLESNKELIQDILANGVSIKEPIVGKLTGKVFAITGSTNIKRSELEKMITNFGGEYKSSINKSCSHLIIADPNSTSTKAVSAKKLGIKLISEDDFISLLQ